MQAFRIEPVPARRQREATSFLVGGLRDDLLARAQANVLLEATLRRHPERAHLWWALDGRRCLAAAMVFDNVGRTAMLFASPAGAPGVHAQALVQLVAGISQHALGRGITVVQAMLPPDDEQEINALHAAGLVSLAELVYMRRSLVEPVEMPPRPDLAWIQYGQFDDRRLGRLIESTYGQSLDCPRLEGVRQVQDVLAGHKESGEFCPSCWWIVVSGGQDAGCILVNDHPESSAADVVYMGVAQGHRGKGLGRALVNKALSQARDRGVAAVTLAVDAANAPARRIYDSAGFRETQRRLAMAVLAKRHLPTANPQIR